MSVASSGYCHITGLTKAMPKSNFIPMMPVLSQKEQAQLYGCRITMCSYMDHNFVPIIEFGKGKGIGVDSCRVTGHQSVSIKRKIPLPEESDNEMKRVYRFRNDHRYMEPFLSRLANPGEKAVMEELLDRMRNTTKMDSSNFFVYALNDKRTGKTGLVLPFEYEEGIRTGVIEHIMLSGDSNKLVVRIRDGPICTIPMDKITKKQIECLSDDAMLFDGRGPNRDILEAQRRDKAAREHDDRDQMAMYLAEMERKRYEREERNKEKMKERIKLKMAEAEEAERRQKVCDEEIRKQYEEAVRIRAEAEAQRAAALEVRLAAREQREAEARAARAEELALEAEEKIRQQEEMRLAENEAERRQQEAAASALADIVPQDMSVNELLDHMRDHAGDSDILQCMEEAADTGMSSTEIVNLVSKSAVEAIEEQFADSSEGHSSHQEGDISDEYSDDEELMCSLSAEQGARQVFQQTTGRTLSINREDKEGECDENIVAGGNQTSKKTFSDDENACLKDITGDALVLRKDQIHSEQADNAVQTQSEQPEELNVEEEQWMKELEELRIQEMERKRLEREKKKLERQKKKEEQELKDEEKRIAKEAKEKKKQEMYERMAAIRKADAADDAKLLEEPEKKEMPTIEIKRRYKPEQQTENTEEDPTVIVKPEKADQLFAEEDLPSAAKIPSNTMKLSEESEKTDQLPTEEDPTSATLQQQCNITANTRKSSEESVKRLESESEGDTPEEFLVQARDGRMVATRSELDDSCIVEGRISLDDSTGAPKVTPGRMIHVDKGTEFIAGKVVPTRDGEEFVPGKDVRTTEGIKFVPGQSVGTDKGMQFFPGMTFSDGDKVEFVPGHVVNMDADEVFVPGQVVSTDKDSVFVPGSVYHSNAGPLFVPGVVQNREFLPGQVIETENGPRYVATSVTANPSAERKGKAAVAGADKMPPSAIGPSWSERRSRKIAPVIIDPADLPPMQPVSRYANMTLDDGPLFLEPNPNRPRKVFEEPEYYSRYLHEMKKNQEEAKSKVMDEEPEESFSYMVQSFDLDPNELELCRKLEHSAPLAPCFEGLKIQDSARLMQLAARAYRAKVIPQAISLPSPPKSKRQVYENVRVTFLDCVDRATRALATTADKLLKKEFLGQQAKRMQRILADDVNNPLPIADVTAFLRLCCSLPNAVFEVGQWIDGLFGHSDRGVFRPLECLVHRKLSRKVSLLKVLTGVVLSADSEAEAAGQKDAVLQSLVAILQKEMPRRTHVDDHREKTQEMISAIILTAGKVVLNDIFNSVAYGDELFVGSVLSGVKESIQELACDPDAVVTLEQGIVSYVQDITKRRLLCLLEYSRQPESLQREGLSYHVVVHEALGLALLEDDLETAECLRLCLATPGLVGLLPLHQRAWEYVGTAVTLHALADGDEARQRLLHDLAKYPNVLRKNDQWLRFLSGARVVVQFGSGLRSQRLNTAADITDEVISLVAQSCSEDVERLFHAVMLEAARHVYALEAAGSGRGGPPVVVLKHQFEGIVPRDQARDVINGRVEYLLVDETGVRFFRVGELDGRRLERMERASQWADAVANGVGCLPGQDPAKARKTSALKRQEHELYGSELLDQERIMDSTGLYQQLETTRDASNKRVKLEGGLDLNLSSEGLLDNSAAKHKISIRPSRRHADPRHSDSRSGYRPEDKPWSPDLPANSGVVLSQLSAAESQHLLDQRGAVVRELLETEEEFVRDTQFILENYYRHLDSAQMPRALRDQKEPLFANFPLLCDFHCRELLEGIKYYADNPLMIGKTFLRLAPEFEKHAIYCRDEPEMQALLQNNQQLREYFQEYSQRLNDEKSLSEHLRLPIQRINDYQLLLKDLVHLSSALGEDCTDLERALEFILGIPQRSRDLQYINSIQGYRGCLQRLGRLLKHDWFAETESDGKSRQRYLFLFKSRILICKPNKISDTKSVFILKRIVQLSGVTFSESLEDDSSFSLHLKPVDSAPYPIHLRCRSPEARHCWLQQLHELAEQQALCPEPASAVGEEDLVIDSALCDEADEEFFTASHDAFPKDPLSVSTGISSSGLSAAGPTRPLRHSVADPTGHVISHSEADPGNAQRIGGTAQVHRPTRHSVATAPQSAAAVSIETSQQQLAEPCVTPTPVAMEMEAPNPQPDGTDSHPSHIPEVDESIPRFVEKIKGFNCEPGEKAVFECRVEADPPAVVTWLRNNRPMDDRLADRVMISSDMDRHTLKVLNCTVEDSGLICAKAVNNCGDSVCSAMLDVQQLTEEDRRERRRQLAPQFSIHLKNTEILERAAVVFMVKAEGNPQPTIEFFKDGGPLTLTDRVTVTRDPSGSHELYIHHVVPEDAGLYRCVATNDKGREECEGQITVTEPVDLAVHEERDLPRKGGAVINAKCGVGVGVRVGGEPEKKSDTSAAAKSKSKPSGPSRAVSGGVSAKESAAFGGGLKKGGAAVAPAKKAAKTPARGRKKGVAASGKEGDAGTKAEGDDEAVVFSLLDKKKVLDEAASSNFAWFKDGEEFDPAERFKVLFKDEEDTLALVFQHVTPEDAGMYTCVAATESGRISCSAELTVQGGVKQLPSEPEAPCVVEPLQNTEVSLGGSAMLECKMRGYPAVNVTWSLNGEEIKSGERFKVLYEDCESMALIIKSVVETDSGKVCLVARNNLGECVSEASLIVKSCPRLLRPLSDVAIMCDEPVRMEAEIAGTPAPDVKWYKDGQRVMESDRVRFMQETDTKFVMLIDRMTLQDAGSYSIVASNSMGQLSEFWKVSGQAPPKFIKQLFRETVKNEQENAVLEVKVQGSPVPVVKWFKDGSELTIDGRHYTVENDGHIYALTINGVAREDTAEYVCRVSNEFGKDQTSSQLHVRCSPEVEQGLQDRDVYEKEPFVLEVKVSGYPEPMIRWFIGEMEITEEHKRYKKERAGKFIRLKVESADSEIIGQYRCTLKNELGSCETSAFINVLKSPEFVEPLKDLGWDENKSLTLQVQILAVPDPEVKWYHEGEEIKGSSGDMTVSQDGEFHSLHFSTLKEVHQGSIRVQASNSQGENSSTMFLTVYKTRDLPSNNPLGSPFDPTSNPRRRYGMSSTNEKTSVTDNYINESPCLYSQIDSQSERTVNGREERSDDVNNGCGASNKHQGDKSKHQKEYLRDSVSSPSHNDRDRNSDRCAVDVSISEEFKEDSYKSREINSEKVSKTNISQKNNTDVREDVVNPDQQVMRETSSKVDNKRSYDSDGRFSTVSTEEIADLPTHTSVRPDDIDSCTIVKTSTEIGSAKSDEMVDLTCRRDWANASPSRSHVSFDIDHREDISKTGLYETTEETHSHVIQIYEGSHGTSEGEEEDFSGRKVDHVMNVSVGVENGVAVTANFSIQLDLEVTENGENEGGDVENAAKIELETIVSDDDTTDGTILEETELTVTSYDRSAEQNGQSACDINVSVTVGELADTALNGLGDQELHNTNNNMHVDDNECHVSDLKRPFTVESTHVKDRKQEDSSGVEDYSIEVKCNDQSGTAVDFWSIIADNEGNSGCAEQCDHVKFTRNDVLSDSSDDTLVTEDVRDSKNQLLILKTTIDDFSSNNVDQTTRIDIEVQSSLQVGTHMVDGEDNFNTPSSYKLELVADKSDNSNRLKSCSGVQCVDNAAVEEPAVIDADVGDMAVVDTTVEKEVVVGAVVEEEADAIVEDMTAVDADFVEAADTDVFVEEKAVVDTDVEVVNIDASVEEDTIVDASVEAEAAVDADVEEDAAIDADVEEEGAVNAGVEEQAVVDAAIEEVVNIDASVEEYTIVDASVEAEAAVDADVEEEAAIDADVEEEAAVNADVEEFANIDAFVEEEAVVDADVEEVEAVDAVVEEVAAVDAAVEEEAAVDAEVEEAAAVGATVGDSEVVDVTAEGSIVVDAAVEDVTAVDADVEDVEDVDGVESLKTSELRINDIDYWTSENSNRMKLGDRRSQSIHENTVSASCDKSYSQDMPTRPNVDEQSSLEPCHVSSSDRFPHPNEKRNSLEMAHESPPKPSLSYEGTRRFLSKDASKFAELFGKTVDSEGISGLTQSLDSDGESDGNDKVDDVSETLLVDNGSEVKDEVEQVGMTTSPAKTDLEVHECITTKTDITGDDNILHKMLPSHDSDVGGDDLDASEFEIEDCTYACKPNILNQTSSHVEADNVTPQGKPLLGSESTPSEWGDDNAHSLQDLSEAPVDAKSNYLASTAELSADESTISTRLSDKIDLKYVSESPSSNFERFSADNDVKTHSSTSEEISVQSTIDSVVESPIAAVIQAESQETPADVEVKSPEYHQSAVTSNDNDPDSRVRHSLDESSDEEETEKNAPTSPSDTNIALPELSTDGAQLDLVTPLRQALHTEDVNSALTVTVEGKAKVTAPGILNIEKLTSERDGCFLPRHYQLQCPCPAKTSSEILEGLMADGAWITVRPNAALQIHADKDDSAKPQILTKFTDLICFITENKILTVQGYGNPIPEPHWHMDGAEIHSSEDYVIQQDKHQYRLIIPRVRYEDAGQYKLALKNHMGQAEEQCKLVVKPLSELKEPHFFTHIFDDTKKKGDEVTLSMEIRGNPQPDIKWFKDDVELAPDTNIMMTYDLESCVYTLKIRRISDGDMGTYVCRATNEYGTEQEQARIDVIFKPEISGLREIPAVPGEGATLHATIKSNPKCRLKWQHDQKDLKSSHNVIITTNEENTETSVQILTVGMYDGGIYSVVAENTQGETISNGLILLRTALPTFKKRLLNTGARLGDRLRLEAVITGLPVPDVSWFKEDAPLQVERIDEDTYRFMVDEVTSPDYGQYRIVAMNCVGSSECCCDVTEVVLPPVIETRLPTFHKMDEAETLVLEVKTDGNPPPEVCWMLDNEPLQLSDRVRAVQLQDGVCQLTVEDLRPEDAGRYRLVASNGNGDAATETAVTVDRVLSKPRFENILDDVEVTAGRPLKLETRVLGYPKPGVKWLKNGVPLHSSEHISITNTPQGTSILDIENATLEDSGAYSVIAVNDLGEESLDADVVVEPARKKPCLLEALTAVRAVEGYPARVEGRFSGVPAPLVSWFRDGEPVDLGSSRAKPYTLPDGTFGLLLPCCEQEDSGVYKACVANLVGRLQTETKLDVIAKQRPGPEMAPQFSATLRDTEVNEGSQLLLTAEVAGNPLPDVCWSKDNVPLDTGDERVFTGYDGDKVALSVRPSRVRDAGRYHVVLSSKLGQADASCVVRVKKTYQAPHFSQKVTDIQQVPGFDGKFLGRVSGTPRPDVEWLYNDMPIGASSKKYRIKRDADMCGLHVIDCEMRDAGIYTCVARNVDGEARCSAHLDVVEKIERRVRSEAPFFLKTIAPCEVFPEMQGKFTACVAGSPEPQYEWYKNDVRIMPSDRVLMETDGCGLIRLVIKHADDADSGRYRLKIYNTHGDAACEADLFYDTLDGGFGFGSRDHNQTVDRQMRTGIPVPLCDRPLISRMNDRQLTLSWHPSPTAGHHMPVTYHVEMAEMPRGDWFSVRTGVRGCSVEVRNLEPHRDYRFRVKVENKHGTSDASPYVVTQRERFVPEGGSAFSYLPDGEVFKPDLSSHFPRDFDMDKWSAGRGCPPTPEPGRSSRLCVDYDAASRRRIHAIETSDAQTRPWRYEFESQHPPEAPSRASGAGTAGCYNEYRARAIYADAAGSAGPPPSQRDSPSGNLIIERLMVRRQLDASLRQQQKLDCMERRTMTRHMKSRAERKTERQWEEEITGDDLMALPQHSRGHEGYADRRPLSEISNHHREDQDELLSMYRGGSRQAKPRDWEQAFNDLIEDKPVKASANIDLTSVRDWERRFLSQI